MEKMRYEFIRQIECDQKSKTEFVPWVPLYSFITRFSSRSIALPVSVPSIVHNIQNAFVKHKELT